MVNSMKKDEELVLLKIRTADGDIEIPFISLELLDEFTVRYKDKDELINSLLSMLNLSIDKKSIIDAYIYYEYEKNGQVRSKTSRIKYSKHNFDKKNLPDYLKDFLKKDHDMIHYCGVRKIKSKGMYEFLHGGNISDFEIDYAVNEYFNDAPYGIYRKVYFFLIDNGVFPTVNRIVNKGKESISRDLYKFNSDDVYIQSMLRNIQNEDDYDKIYEELSKIDLEDLKTMVTNPHFGLFDGIENDRTYTLEDLYDLENCTGMDIDLLCDYVSGFRKKGSRR